MAELWLKSLGELGRDWHTVNDAVIAYGQALIDDDSDRIGEVTALGRMRRCFVAKVRGVVRCGARQSSTSAPEPCCYWRQ
ncbi:MAG: hypothetical protein WAM81_01570, partial [Acidimicrobiia bacterium]